MELVGQRVDDRHGGGFGHRAQTGLPVGAPDDGIDIAGQHFRGVLQRLLAAELGAAAVDHHCVPAELGDTHLEREPGAGGVLVEDHRDAAGAVQRAVAERVFLQLGGQRQHLGLFIGLQVVVAQEVSDHCAPLAVSRMPGNAVTNVSS